MRIGLDIDNVVSDFDAGIFEAFLIEDKNKRSNGIVNPNGRWIKHLFDWTNDEVEEFFNNNMERISLKLKPRKDAKKYMDKLLSEGHELYLISNRVYPHYSNPYEVTKKWLDNNNINYTKLVLSESNNKTKECIDHNIDIMFDDGISNCKYLLEGSINCYLMATKYNLKYKEDLLFVNDWKELYEVIKNG